MIAPAVSAEDNNMNPDIKRQAEQYIDYLALPEAIARKGATWCSTHRMVLAMSLKSITQQESEQRIVKQLAEIKAALRSE